MRKKCICSILIFFAIWFANINIYAKYIDDVEIDVANVELDRTRPVMLHQCWETVNKYMTEEGKKYDVTFGMIIQEKNLAEDVIRRDMIKTWVDDVETELEIKITETEHTEEEHKYTIEVIGITGTGNFKLVFQEGAVSDLAGWTNTLFTVDMRVSL